MSNSDDSRVANPNAHHSMVKQTVSVHRMSVPEMMTVVITPIPPPFRSSSVLRISFHGVQVSLYGITKPLAPIAERTPLFDIGVDPSRQLDR